MGGLRFAFVLFFASEQPILRAVPLFLSLPLLLKTCFGGLSIPREKSKNFNPFFPHYEHPTSQHKRAQKRERERRHTYIFCELSANHKDRLQFGRDERERREDFCFRTADERRERDSFFLFFRPQEGHVVIAWRERERQLLRLPKHGQKRELGTSPR